MGHGAAGGNAVHLVGEDAGGPGAAADIGRPRAGDRGVGALGAAGAELEHGPPLGGAADAAGFGGDQALVVQLQQNIGFNELGLDRRGADRQDRLAGEHRGPLRRRPDIAGKTELFQIVQKILAEQPAAAQIGDVLPVKMQVEDVVDHLVQSRADGIAAPVRHTPEKHVKIADPVLQARAEIAVGHTQLIKIAEHRQVQFVVLFHISSSPNEMILSLIWQKRNCRKTAYDCVLSPFGGENTVVYTRF